MRLSSIFLMPSGASLGRVDIHLINSAIAAIVATAGTVTLTSRDWSVRSYSMTQVTRDPLYRRHRFPAEVIDHAVWLYLRFPHSLRMVEDFLAALGSSSHTRLCAFGWRNLGSNLPPKSAASVFCRQLRWRPHRGLVVSVAPYSTQVINVAQIAAENGFDVIAITDRASSPLVRFSKSAIFVPHQSSFISNSITSFFAVAECIINAVAAATPKATKIALVKRQQLIERLPGMPFDHHRELRAAAMQMWNEIARLQAA